MPYLSWNAGGVRQRHWLDGTCILGRDAAVCQVAQPTSTQVSRQHAKVTRQGSLWWVRDLGSVNGTLLNGLQVPSPMGGQLMEGDILRLGDWELVFTRAFPGLDGVRFAEAVGTPLQEARPEPSQSATLLRGMELLAESLASLLKEGQTEALLHSLLGEALKLFQAERGFVVMGQASGQWRRVASVGQVEEGAGLSGTILGYVAQHEVALLSNAPMLDPRFEGRSIAALHRGPLMCAPLEAEGRVLGMLYLDRKEAGGSFTRLDLALFQSLVRLGTLALRHTQLAQEAFEKAELQGQVARIRGQQDHVLQRVRGALTEVLSVARWIDMWGQGLGPQASVMVQGQTERLRYLAGEGFHALDPDVPAETSGPLPLGDFQNGLVRAWEDLLRIRGGACRFQPAAQGTVWGPRVQAQQGVSGLVEPLLMRLGDGLCLEGSWHETEGAWEWHLHFPAGLGDPVPDTWTRQALLESGLQWHWRDPILVVVFPKVSRVEEGAGQDSRLVLISRDPGLHAAFQRLSEVGGGRLLLLEAVPPQGPVPHVGYLVLDVHGMPRPVDTLRAYRRHQDFASVPILVVRIQESQLPEFLAAGATDWLPEGFRLETLHHRLQVLQSIERLRRMALASERLDSFRKMAGTLKHEINNPLAVISMQVELLERKYPDEAKLGKIGDMVERIRDLLGVLQQMREAPLEDYPGGESIVRLG